MRRCSRGVVVITACAAAWSVGLSAQDEPFKKGMDARGDRKWADAARHMAEAIALDPKESTRKVGARLGIGGDEYLPHFHLGEARFNQGECAGALAAWDESERQAIIRRNERHLATLRKGSADCESKGFLAAPKLAAESQRAAAVLKAAASAELDFMAFRAAHTDAVTAESRSAADRARADLAGAGEKIESARSSRRGQDMTEAIASAESARRGYVSVRGLLGRAVDGASRISAQIADAERTIGAAERSSEALAALVASSPVKLTLSSATADARRRADEALGSARERLAAARKSRVERGIAEARTLALDAEAAFSRAHADIEKARKTAIDTELRVLGGNAGAGFAAVDTRLAAIRDALAAGPPDDDAGGAASSAIQAAQSSLGRARRRFDQAVRASDVVAARTAASAVPDLHAHLDAIGVLLGGPAPAASIPDVLRGAAQSFFDARYQDVLNALTEDAAASVPAQFRAHAYVIRAASSFALFEYSGGRDQSLRAAARRDADAGRQLDPAFSPNPSAFGPKFLAFFSGRDAQP